MSKLRVESLSIINLRPESCIRPLIRAIIRIAPTKHVTANFTSVIGMVSSKFQNSTMLQEDLMRKTMIALSTAFFFTCIGTSLISAETGAHLVTPEELKWSDVPSLPKGAKVAMLEGPISEAVPFTIRLKFPANYEIPAHWHPAIEHVTVISGAFNLGMGDKFDRSKTKPLGAGSAAIMQPKTNHFAWTKEETIIQVHGVGPWAINYVNPTDDPRKK